MNDNILDMRIFSKEDAERNLLSQDSYLVAETLISISLNEIDVDWAEKQCLQYLAHSDNIIRYAAILAVAHIARLHGRFNSQYVVPYFKEYLKDSELFGRVEDAISDICIYTNTDESIFRS